MTIFLKATLKLNEKPVQILEFSFCWSLSNSEILHIWKAYLTLEIVKEDKCA
jgi:hypothetical protein